MKEGLGKKVGELPSTEHFLEPAMTWKLLDKYKGGVEGGRKSNKNTTSDGAFEP